METSEEETTVRLVDYGYMETVQDQDSQCLRELPEEWRHFMTMAVELELGVIPIEENQDVLNALSIFGFVCNLQDCDLSLFLYFVVLILLFNPITSSRSHVSTVRCCQEDQLYQGCPGAQVARQSARISRRMK